MRKGWTLACAASIAAAATLFPVRRAESCTTFALEGQGERVFAKSYDWHIEHGMLVANARGVQKHAFELMPGDRGADWVSTYGSLTFNQYGREFPNAGINEAGLVVEVMLLTGSSYPVGQGQPSVNESQWVQYQLDRRATVAEVLAGLNDVRVSLVRVPLHYLVCDAAGECATIEGVGGSWSVRTGSQLTVPVLANDTYASSLRTLSRYRGFGGFTSVPSTGSGSLTRFVRAADHVTTYDPLSDTPVDWAFEGLAKVSSSGTQWQIVYEQNARRVHFATRSNAHVRTVDATKLDYTCGATVATLDLEAPLSGDVTARMVPYDPRANTSIVTRSLQGMLPAAVLTQVARYPETTSCAP